MNKLRKTASKEEPNEYIKITTHPGTFSTDEVVACAIVYLYADGKIQIVRNAEKNDTTKIHMYINGKEIDLNSSVKKGAYPCFCAGIMWKKFGKQSISLLLNSTDAKVINRTFDRIDNKYIYPIDQELINGKDVRHPFQFVKLFEPIWEEKVFDSSLLYDDSFFAAFDCVKEILYSAILTEYSYCDAQLTITEAFNKTILDGKFILELPCFIPWEEKLIELNSKTDQKISFVACPDFVGTFTAYCVPIHSNMGDYLINIPDEWIGLNSAKLKKVTGIQGVLTCTKTSITASTQAAIIKLCTLIYKLNKV